MIKNCITNATPLFTIETESLLKLSEDKYNEYEALAQSMSEEMGVPKELLFVRPHFFFLDQWHKIDEEWYFYKSDGYDFHFVNELLGEVISEYFDLDTVHYQVAQLCVKGEEPEYGLVSKNFCSKEYLYTRTWDYNLTRGDIHYLDNLRDICKNEEEFKQLLSDMKKFIIRDFYTSQGDRSGNNFLFQEKKDGSEGKRLAPLYDYENAYQIYPSRIYNNQILYVDMKDKELPNFFKKDKEYQESLCKIRDADMNQLMDIVEERHNILIPNDLKEYYRTIDKEKKEIIKEYRLVRVSRTPHTKRTNPSV